jgi:hypothetical protein
VADFEVFAKQRSKSPDFALSKFLRHRFLPVTFEPLPKVSSPYRAVPLIEETSPSRSTLSTPCPTHCIIRTCRPLKANCGLVCGITTVPEQWSRLSKPLRWSRALSGLAWQTLQPSPHSGPSQPDIPRPHPLVRLANWKAPGRCVSPGFFFFRFRQTLFVPQFGVSLSLPALLRRGLALTSHW